MTEQEIWWSAYLAALSSGYGDPREKADQGLEDWNEFMEGISGYEDQDSQV